MATVCPCSMSVETYAAAGRRIALPAAACPSCGGHLAAWSGYWRFVRDRGECVRIFVRRGRCRSCGITQALLPAFLARNRLDTTEAIGATIEAVVHGRGMRPVAEALGAPHTTVRGWIRRFATSARRLATGFSALAVELGGAALLPPASTGDWALLAIRAAWRQASALPGWLAVGCWRFVSCVCGGSLLAANTNSPWFFVGRRRFMPPAPRAGGRGGG